MIQALGSEKLLKNKFPMEVGSKLFNIYLIFLFGVSKMWRVFVLTFGFFLGIRIILVNNFENVLINVLQSVYFFFHFLHII